MIATLPDAGIQAIAIVPLGFVSDHMEVLWDLDTEAMEASAEAGIRAVRTPTPGVDPVYVSGLVDLLLERTAGDAGSPAPARDRPRTLVRRVPPGMLRERPCRLQAGRSRHRTLTLLPTLMCGR